MIRTRTINKERAKLLCFKIEKKLTFEYFHKVTFEFRKEKNSFFLFEIETD